MKNDIIHHCKSNINKRVKSENIFTSSKGFNTLTEAFGVNKELKDNNIKTIVLFNNSDNKLNKNWYIKADTYMNLNTF